MQDNFADVKKGNLTTASFNRFALFIFQLVLGTRLLIYYFTIFEVLQKPVAP